MYLAGIQFHTTILGHPILWQNFSRVYYALRGIRRVQGNQFTRPPRSPITLRHLSVLLDYFNAQLAHPDNLMLSSAVLLAFFALLRASEYTSTGKRTFDPERTLMFNDVRFHRNFRFVQIRIAQSKTDPFRVGCLLKVWATGKKLCPVLSLRRFVEAHPFGSGPMFAFSSGSFLTRAFLSDVIQLVLHDVNLNTHSFRIGGASAAAAAGIPDSTIQIMGRWASNAYRAYLRIPDKTLKRVTRFMSQKNRKVSAWAPQDVDF